MRESEIFVLLISVNTFFFLRKQSQIGVCSPLKREKMQSCLVIDLLHVEDCRFERDSCKNKKTDSCKNNMIEVDKDFSTLQTVVHAKAQSVLDHSGMCWTAKPA